MEEWFLLPSPILLSIMKPVCLLLPLALALSPLASAVTLSGITVSNQLVRFDSSDPSTFLSSVPVTGLVASDGVTSDPFATIVDLAYNPNDGSHYGLDSNANFYRLASSGVATLLSSSFSPAGFDAGFDYDPLSGGFVFASDASEHFGISTTGATVPYPDLVFGAGDVNQPSFPTIFGLAFDPDFGTGWFIDSNLDVLAQSIDPALGEIFTVGSLGFDVTSFGELMMDADGNLWATLSTDGLSSGLYSIDTTTGAASLVGNFNEGLATIAAVPEPSALCFGALSLVPLLRRRRRA